MLRQLRIHTKPLINPSCLSLTCRSSSSSSSLPPPPEQDPASDGDSPPPDSAAPGGSTTPKSNPYSTYFSDIKERLKSAPSPPRRIPTNLQPPSAFSAAAKPAQAASLEEIRKHLSEFRLRSSGPSSGELPRSSSARPFQDLLKNDRAGSDAPRVLSLEAIRESLRKFQAPPRDNEGLGRMPGLSMKPFQDELRKGFGEDKRGSQLIGTEKLPESIFGKERREKKREGGEEEPTVRRTEFVKMYSYEELGQKLRKLRPEKDGKKDQSFSLSELNERLAKLRELEEKETESRMGGVSFRDLRESLQRLKDADAKKKANMSRFTFLTSMSSPGTPAYMLKPPQEHLIENYFHPDHMSSGEKLKLQLKKVRDEYKTSENDCGSTQVQVAQLTTKIKHLSSVLHKKDKHSRKGLLEMVQLRKKLLKYLRRTDWDSYCVILSKLGLRDVPDYKIANYKS